MSRKPKKLSDLLNKKKTEVNSAPESSTDFFKETENLIEQMKGLVPSNEHISITSADLSSTTDHLSSFEKSAPIASSNLALNYEKLGSNKALDDDLLGSKLSSETTRANTLLGSNKAPIEVNSIESLGSNKALNTDNINNKLGSNKALSEDRESIFLDEKCLNLSQLGSNKAPIEVNSIESLGSNKALNTDNINNKLGSNKALNVDSGDIKDSANKAPDQGQLGSNKALSNQLGSNKALKSSPLSSNKALTNTQLGSNRALDKALPAQQLGSKFISEGPASFYDLIGRERQFILFIYNYLVTNFVTETLPLTTEFISEQLGSSINATRLVVQKLQKKNLLIVTKSSRGVAGWRRFMLPDQVLRDIKQSEHIKDNIDVQLGSNKALNKALDKALNSPSKLVSKYNNTNYLSNDSWFLKLDFTSIPGVRAASINKSIRENVEANLDEDTTQDFLNRFMPWLATQSNVRNPLALLCDKLKEFAEIKDSPVLAVQTTEEIEIEAAMAESAAKLRSQMDLIAKNREAEQEHKLNAEFEAFYHSATDDELIALVAPTSFSTLRSETHKRTVKEVYLQNLNK